MTQHGPCGCDHDHATEEKKDHDCCGGRHCHDEKEMTEEHECCGGGHCHDDQKSVEDSCGCGHDHGHSHALSPEDLQKLKDAITEAGYQIEETPDGNVRILEK